MLKLKKVNGAMRILWNKIVVGKRKPIRIQKVAKVCSLIEARYKDQKEFKKDKADHKVLASATEVQRVEKGRWTKVAYPLYQLAERRA